MTLLICIAIVMVGASVITTYAAMTAREGYEDEAGFQWSKPVRQQVGAQHRTQVEI